MHWIEPVQLTGLTAVASLTSVATFAGNMPVNPMGAPWMQQPYVQQGQHFVPMMPPGTPVNT